MAVDRKAEELAEDIIRAISQDRIESFVEEKSLTKEAFLEYDSKGQTPFHFAAEKGYLDRVAKAYDKMGVKFTKKELATTQEPWSMDDFWNYSKTALHFAAEKGQLDIVLDNMDKTSPPDKESFFETDDYDVTPFAIALKKEEQLDTALDIMAVSGQGIEKEDLLKASGEKKSLITTAFAEKKLDLLSKALVANGKTLDKDDFTKSEKNQETTLSYAAENRKFKEVNDAVTVTGGKLNRTDLEQKNTKGINTIQMVFAKGGIELLDSVLKQSGDSLKKKDMETVGKFDKTGFHTIVENGHIVEAVNILKANGETATIEDILEGTEKLGKERKARVLYEKTGTRLQQLCDAELFSVKSLNKFWREMPDGFKSNENKEVFRKSLSKIRNEETSRLGLHIKDTKGR